MSGDMKEFNRGKLRDDLDDLSRAAKVLDFLKVRWVDRVEELDATIETLLGFRTLLISEGHKGYIPKVKGEDITSGGSWFPSALEIEKEVDAKQEAEELAKKAVEAEEKKAKELAEKKALAIEKAEFDAELKREKDRRAKKRAEELERERVEEEKAKAKAKAEAAAKRKATLEAKKKTKLAELAALEAEEEVI